MADAPKLKVMLAGIGGASLGTELLKCLTLADRYEVFGCDVSPTAYGLYDPGFSRTFLARRDRYVPSVIDACRTAGAQWLVPGGEQPMVLLGAASAELAEAGVTLIGNLPEVVATFSDKGRTFEVLAGLGFTVPRTTTVRGADDLAAVGMPCIVKPATGSGGSAMVFFAVDPEEAMTYADYIRRSGGTPLAQEYIGPEEGEFTVGVLTLPDGALAGSIALRRSLDAKLSVMSRGRGGVVSSGYSQGFIGDFPAIRARAEAIALAVGSRGAINIQGRVRGGELIPFEINPRLSASTYLRALAGFNEVDILLQHGAFGVAPAPATIREGWYLRS
ncbi:MAG TPA: ATP-grasp domain-containing protein, partial [Gemmatimonadaceae bacterium]|nr:ATP-grasp domain-containing protein [Gemmatimonadaceae bacterium]